ncbi:MAG: hypothetical protein R3F04_07045 [Lysobacteraceae bacterium]
MASLSWAEQILPLDVDRGDSCAAVAVVAKNARVGWACGTVSALARSDAAPANG